MAAATRALRSGRAVRAVTVRGDVFYTYRSTVAVYATLAFLDEQQG